MNISTYIFGLLENGYSQYPNDYTQTIFQNFHEHSTAQTQIAVHRDNNLIYYGYIRRLEAGQYIGLCVVLNSVMLTNFKEMFNIFENAITNLVVNGIILQFNDKGDIISKTTQLYTNQTEVSRITEYLRAEFTKSEGASKPLPPTNYGIAKNEKRTFSVDNDTNEIVKASVSYNYVYVYKQNDFDTQSLSSYRGIVNRLNKEKTEIAHKYWDLQQEHTKVLRQKKQFQLVIILFCVILSCGIGLLLLNDNLKMTKNELTEANNTISIQNDSIRSKNSQISNLQRNIHNLKVDLSAEVERRESIEEEFYSFQDMISERQPLLIKSTSFNFNTGWLSFDYYGLREETITMQVKAFGDYNYSNSSNINIEKGHRSASIYLNSSLSDSNWYSFELLLNNIIVGGDRH